MKIQIPFEEPPPEPSGHTMVDSQTMFMIGNIFRKFAHKGFQVDPDRVKIQVDPVPKIDDYVNLTESQKRKIVFE